MLFRDLLSTQLLTLVKMSLAPLPTVEPLETLVLLLPPLSPNVSTLNVSLQSVLLRSELLTTLVLFHLQLLPFQTNDPSSQSDSPFVQGEFF